MRAAASSIASGRQSRRRQNLDDKIVMIHPDRRAPGTARPLRLQHRCELVLTLAGKMQRLTTRRSTNEVRAARRAADPASAAASSRCSKLSIRISIRLSRWAGRLALRLDRRSDRRQHQLPGPAATAAAPTKHRPGSRQRVARRLRCKPVLPDPAGPVSVTDVGVRSGSSSTSSASSRSRPINGVGCKGRFDGGAFARRSGPPSRVVGEDHPLQLPQLRARLQPQLVGQHPPGRPILSQRLRLTARAGKGPGSAGRATAPERLLDDQSLQLANQLGVRGRAQDRPRSAPPHTRAGALQPTCLGLRERLVAQVGQRGASPQRERLVEQLMRPASIPRARAPAPHGTDRSNSSAVHRSRLHPAGNRRPSSRSPRARAPSASSTRTPAACSGRPSAAAHPTAHRPARRWPTSPRRISNRPAPPAASLRLARTGCPSRRTSSGPRTPNESSTARRSSFRAPRAYSGRKRYKWRTKAMAARVRSMHAAVDRALEVSSFWDDELRCELPDGAEIFDAHTPPRRRHRRHGGELRRAARGHGRATASSRANMFCLDEPDRHPGFRRRTTARSRAPSGRRAADPVRAARPDRGADRGGRAVPRPRRPRDQAPPAGAALPARTTSGWRPCSRSRPSARCRS